MTEQSLNTHRKLSIKIILLLALLTALDAMSIDMYLPAMPSIAEAFSVNAGKVQQTLSVFLIGLALGQAAYGPLLDRFGRKIPLLIGMILFIGGSVYAACAASVEHLLIARFIQASGAAAGLVTPRAVVSDVCNMTESARTYSVLMQVMMLTPILAPIAGGVLLSSFGWQSIFWGLALFGAVGLIWSVSSLEETHPPGKRKSLNFLMIIVSYAVMFRNKKFMAYTLAGGFILGSLFNYISSSAFVYTTHYKLTTTQFSLIFAVNSAMLIAGGVLSTLLLKKGVRESTQVRAGVLLHAGAGAMLCLVLLAGLASFWIFACFIAFAIGVMGLVFGTLTALTMQEAGDNAGVASSIMGSLQYLMSSLTGIAISIFSEGPEMMAVAIFIHGLMAALCLHMAKN
jgi:DHA1 family bicyclomycin/chloramphenicol resistance-like MFS transporter